MLFRNLWVFQPFIAIYFVWLYSASFTELPRLQNLLTTLHPLICVCRVDNLLCCAFTMYISICSGQMTHKLVTNYTSSPSIGYANTSISVLTALPLYFSGCNLRTNAIRISILPFCLYFPYTVIIGNITLLHMHGYTEFVDQRYRQTCTKTACPSNACSKHGFPLHFNSVHC